MFDRIPDSVQLHFLENGIIGYVEKKKKDLDKTWEKIKIVGDSIRSPDYRAAPAAMKCGYCPYNEICSSSAV
ncbi:PD-(D/E)XK nuclease family protein [Candidatus Saganbacteria bacterium]|nr:PD-(D/E)XK nuclease family protein [Candidatus Saganbacteria bacterium]